MTCAWLLVPLLSVAVPTLSGRVVDEAQMLSSAQREELSRQLEALEAQTSAQVAIATLPSLEGEPIEAVSLRIAQAWRLGQKDKDNGVLVLLARDDRQVRIEVGYGLEAAVTDALANRIIEERMVPYFRSANYHGGLVAGLQGLSLAIRREYPEPPPPPPPSWSQNAPQLLSAAFLCAIGWFVTFGVLWDAFGLRFPIVPALVTSFFGTLWLYVGNVLTPTRALVAIPLGFALGWLFAGFGRFMDMASHGRQLDAFEWSSGGFSSSSSSSSSDFSSSGSSFSGGGGSFGGGGASGRW